ncbi:MAG: DNA-directed RNA polymerase subunit beta' [Alphaproteobacteria bacterium]|nr:DNA-directed RNA polymerase subunit beta' [Alphaproteobacteria bacterium]
MAKEIKTFPSDFDSIKVSVASPETIRGWSYGEVQKPETINYRTFKPERGGLFCARIFGPLKDYECLCGKYKRIKFKGVVCERCGVEVGPERVRRERMGHIDLVSPVVHVWFLRSLPSRIGLLLDLPLRDLERILNFDAFIVLDPGLSPFVKYQLLTEEEFFDAQDTYGEDAFCASVGADAIEALLKEVDVEELVKELQKEIHTVQSEIKRRKVIRRYKMAKSFLREGTRPEWMVLRALPVIAPDLRPLVPLEGGRFAASDLNDLYRRVINRNNRLKRLQDLLAPEIIVRNEKRMLQESVDALLDNGRRGKVTTASKRTLKSLADMLRGKQGRFRQNLLGKRVDYSGRSVIVVGPRLRLHQCGLPKRMAIELFKPFIFAKLQHYGIATSVKMAKKCVEDEIPEVWDVLDEVIHQHPVLLNRAPTLHRLGVQGFEPVLIEGKALQLHPLVCASFNADFDGDQMAVHVPISLESQVEVRVLMMSTNNVLSPANGQPVIVPTKDIVLGIYYITMKLDKQVGEGRIFTSTDEVEWALYSGCLSLHAGIKAVYESVDAEGNKTRELVSTTPGRMLFAKICPAHHAISFEEINLTMTGKHLSTLIDKVFSACGATEAVRFADAVKDLGFSWLTKSGISIGKNDFVVPKEKGSLIQETKERIATYDRQYQDGLITRGEKYNKVVDAWSQCGDRVANVMMENLASTSAYDPNSIYMMADSGARGSQAQIKQLMGMRGLLAKPSGEIVETPIVSNFKEGLSVLEYFTSTHGARKGLADTALKTANSGYLTRRLVDVSRDCVVVEQDCGAEKGLVMRPVLQGGSVVVSLGKRVLGRVLLEDVICPNTNEILFTKGTMLDEDLIERIPENLSSIAVRSPVRCEAHRGICVTCYGRDLSARQMVSIGEAVGVIAAQSIGEPGTQLTMRTFHVGGAAQGVYKESTVDAPCDGRVEFASAKLLKRGDHHLVLNRLTELSCFDEKGSVRRQMRLPYGAKVFVENDAVLKKGTKIAEWDPYTVPVIAEVDGVVRLAGVVVGVSARALEDGVGGYVITDWRQQANTANTRPAAIIEPSEGVKVEAGSKTRHYFQMDTVVVVEDGQTVKAGEVLARIPRETFKTRDITGGLPRVSELFEARSPKDSAILAGIGGRIEIVADYKGKHRLWIHGEDEEMEEVLISRSRHLLVQDGDVVRKGDYLVEGYPAPQDILRINGVARLVEYLESAIQEIYRMQGVDIDARHIEVVVRQMCQKVEITDPGDSHFVHMEQVDRYDFWDVNKKLEEAGKKPSDGRPIVQGITKASLQTPSFIAGAAFQETMRVLTEAAVEGKRDILQGLKENIVIGRLIPAGTGLWFKKYKDKNADAQVTPTA